MDKNQEFEKIPPSMQNLEHEARRYAHRRTVGRLLRKGIFKLLVVASLVVLIFSLWLPVFRVTGISMEPTMEDGEYVLAVRTRHFNPGDVIAFHYNNEILVKRVIALAGDWVNIDGDGTVYVNNVPCYEPYIQEKSLGICDIPLPFQVPDGETFVMGDDRPVSLDSRTAMVGTVSGRQVLGRVVFKLWPLNELGPVGQ